MTKIKIALAAALLAVTSSAAFAQGASTRVQSHRNLHTQSASAWQQRNVALPTEGRSPVGPFWYNWSGPTQGGG
jgi:hypothetical protein